MINLAKIRVIGFILILFLNFTCYVFADIKTDVYSKLKCVCCEKALLDCKCPHSKEIKGYIDALVDVGLNEEEIIAKAVDKYSLDVIRNKDTKKEMEKKLIEKAGENRPEILISQSSYDLGRVSKSKGNIKLVVKLQNKGKSTLTINDLKTSCECTKVTLKTKKTESDAFGAKGAKAGWQVKLAAGEKAELIIITDLNHPHVKLGHMMRTVEVKSNDPVHSLVKIEFEAEIVD